MSFFKNLIGFLSNLTILLFGWARVAIPTIKRIGRWIQNLLQHFASIFSSLHRMRRFWKGKISDPEIGEIKRADKIVSRPLQKPIEFKPVYNGALHRDIGTAQIASARIVFQKFGIKYLPAKLVTMLLKNEAFSSFDKFLYSLGFDPNLLIQSHEERRIFKKSIEILMEADILESESELSSDPIYLAVKNRDFGFLEALLEKYRVSARIKKEMSTSSFIFSDFVEACKSIEKGYFDEWHKLKNKDLEDIYSGYKTYARLQHKFEEYDLSIRQRMAILAHLLENREVEEEDREILFHCAGKYNELIEDIEAGRIKAEGSEGWVVGMENLEEEFDILLRAYTEKYDYSIEDDYEEEERGFPEEESPETLEDLLKVLGLEFELYMEWGVVKKAFRKLCMAHHPDHNPDDPEAAGKFMKIKNAYEKLEELYDEKFYKGELI